MPGRGETDGGGRALDECPQARLPIHSKVTHFSSGHPTRKAICAIKERFEYQFLVASRENNAALCWLIIVRH